MQEPSILASLGIDPTASPAPPDDVWGAALQAAFDPSATADADTVPEMDDEPPTLADDDEIIVEPAVLEGPHDGAESGSASDHDVIVAGDHSDLDYQPDDDVALDDAGHGDDAGIDTHGGAGPHDGHYDL